MSVYIENDVLVIENEGTRDFGSLKYQVNKLDPGRIEARSFDYINIKGDIVIKGNTRITSYGAKVLFTGEHIHILDGARLIFGFKYNRGNRIVTSHTCNVKAPNAKTFGSPTGHAGELIMYGGEIDIYCPWNFNGPEARLELIRCNVSGYGTFNGKESLLDTVDFIKSSPKHGILIPTEKPPVFKRVNVLGVKSPTPSDGISNILVINRSNGDINWEGGDVDKYDNLIKVLDSTYNGNINLLGCKVKNGYKIESKTNHMNLYHKFKFNGTLFDTDGAVVPNKEITLLDTRLNETTRITTDDDGRFDEWVKHYQDLAGASEGIFLGPYKITVDDMVYKLNINDNMVNIPLLLSKGETPTDKKLKEITQLLEELSSKVSISEGSVKDLIGTVIIALGDKINTTVDTIESKNGVSVTL